MAKHKLNCQCPFCKAKRGEMKDKNHSMYNKHHTKKSRKKISKNHADVSGDKNPNFGKGYKVSGSKNYNWKNGIQIDKRGYISRFCPYHPNAKNKRYVYEHRLVMEAYLNKVSLKKWINYGLKGNYPKKTRFLTKKEVVHHINEKPNDNRKLNLLLFSTNGVHRKFHSKIYTYLLEQFGVKEMKKCIKWFFKLKDK